MMSQKKLLVVGDSHVWYFSAAFKKGLLYPLEAGFCNVLGATAVGMRNPENMTNSLGKFRNFLKKQDQESAIVIHLGENDCGFVIWYRAQKYQESIEEQTAQSILSYFEFVDELLAKGFTRIIVTGSTMPTIEATDKGLVVSARASITASQIERTELTHVYNRLLREQAELRGLHYVDVTEEVIDPENRVVSKRFRNPVAGDHHMNMDRAAIAWSAKIFPIVINWLATDAPMQAWRPTQKEAYIKSAKAHAHHLPPDMRVQILKGSILTGRYHGTDDKHHVVSEARVDGELINPAFRLLSVHGWTPTPLV